MMGLDCLQPQCLSMPTRPQGPVPEAMSMAISASFKQQCPSCEALVPIKDGSLIGKKVDCPKCKYRFVVEDPVAKDKKAVGGDKIKKNGAADTASVKKRETAVTSKAT